MIIKLGIYGSPSFYGGADTELADQMYIWNKVMGIELHVVPVSSHINPNIKNYIKEVAILHSPKSIQNLTDMPVISFCCGSFLQELPQIRKVSPYIMWVNCMTYSFPAEEKAHINNWIDLHLYQTKHGEDKIGNKLKQINPNFKYMKFIPYFNTKTFEYIKNRDPNKFIFGRISRDDSNKYMPETLDIYNLISVPKEKEAVILGYTAYKQEAVTGPIKESWINVYPPLGISQQNFYRRCDAIVQTSTCYENWPRVGLEAMSSGSVLICYDNEGWRGQIIQEETGFLCKTPRDFIFYASYIAHYPEIRKRVAENAYERLQQIAGIEASVHSWETVFNKISI